MRTARSTEKTPGEELFTEIIDQWLPALQRLTAGYEYSESRRDELLQEILFEIWRSLPSFRAESSLRTWLFRVAHNVAASYRSRSSREHLEQSAPAEWVLGESPRKPDEQLSDKQMTRLLHWVIGQLQPLDRQVILLYMEELPQAEIAEVTGLTRDNVSTRVNRIKTTLTKEMNRRLK